MSQDIHVIDEAAVAIVGAGPSGCAAAVTLARLGHEVVLIDQSEFPRDKPCGDGIHSHAVRILQELELDSVLEGALSVEGALMRSGPAGKTIGRRAVVAPRLPQPRILARMKFDDAMLRAAIGSGVRFVSGRAEQLVEHEGRVAAVVIRVGGASSTRILAKHFIAADGATSRVRRLSRVAYRPPRAFAIRQYARCSVNLDPVVHIHAPLYFNGRHFPGYSWLFPVSTEVANVGVGFLGSVRNDFASVGSLRKVLASVVSEIENAETFGDIVGISEPLGAPIALGYNLEATSDRNTLFVGDAANMTDPVTGEGIAAALSSGRSAAIEIDGRIKRRVGSSYSSRLTRGFPRLDQDVRLVHRAVDRISHEVWPASGSQAQALTSHAFVRKIANSFLTGLNDDPILAGTPVFNVAASRGSTADGDLSALNALFFESLHSQLPFSLDSIHRLLRSGFGPVAATLLFASQRAWGGSPSDCSTSAALAGELLQAATQFLAEATDIAEPDEISLGNGVTTLIADFALSHGLLAGSVLGPAEVARFSRLAQEVFEAAADEVDDLWKLDRTVSRYLDVADRKVGSPHGHAAALGVRLAGVTDRDVELDRFGRRFGVALRISDDAIRLVQGDAPTSEEPGDSLLRGDISLPVIYALEADPGLGDLITEESIADSVHEVLARIRSTDALERALDECIEHADAAKAALEQAEPPKSDLLLALVDMAISRCTDAIRTQEQQ